MDIQVYVGKGVMRERYGKYGVNEQTYPIKFYYSDDMLKLGGITTIYLNGGQLLNGIVKT
jgi:hypothetical protein